MDIYNSNGIKLEYSEVLTNLPITESCEHVEELMKADHIVLSWRDSEKYTLPVGAYITYKGVNYALLEPYEPEQKSGDEFEYTPNFQHPKMYLGKVPFRFPTTDTEGNSITLLEWPYSGDIDTLLTFFCRTMESVLGLTANTFNYSILGEIDMVVSTTFNAVDILSALSNIANQLKCEWHIDWDYKILYFGHIELSRDEVDETVLEVGVNVGTPSVRSSKEGFYNTYEPQGSIRNISKRAASGEYVQGDVRLALNETDYPDKVIYTNESGTVIASLPQSVKKYVKPLIFDNIYPKLDLYVYDVRCRERYLLDDNGEKIIDHYDGSTPVYKRYAVWYMRLAYPTKVDGHVTAWTDYTINPETDIISGKNLGGAFQPNTYSGAESFPLAGRGNADDGGYGFELNYHTTAETIPANPNDGDTGVIIKAGDYEIVFQQQNDYILPTTASQGIIPKGVKVNGQEVTDLNGLTNLDDGQKGNIVDLYNIVIGSAYTESAQDELAQETLKYITNQFKDNNSYTLKSDVVAFKKRIDQDELLHTDSSLYIGEKVIYKNGDYELETRVMKLVTKLDYAFVQEITVGNEVLKGSTTTLKEQVQTILSGGVGNGSGGGGVDAGAVRKIVQAYANPRFLSKLNDDTAQGFITMLKGLQIGANFVPDILGEGGCLRMREDGKVELVTDILYARMRAYFDSVVIREYKHESGNRIVSPAQGFNASRVAYIKVVNNEETIVEDASDADYFRCYWRVDDGEKKTENQFVIGDLAFCEHADVVNGSLVTKRYWRVVVGRNAGNTTTEDGEAWIDLSNAHDANGAPVMTTISWEGQGGVTQTLSVKSFESSTNGIPEAHDDICMLGCVVDTTRQGAIIEYVSGTDAPTYQIYQGLGSDATNPYVLTNKNQISFGYNSSTGKAYMNVYGDAYIGDRNRNTFLEYKQNGAGGNPELNIKAKVQILPNGSTINGQSIPDYIKDNQNNYDDTEVKANIAILDATTQDLQKQIDGAIETWFMTGVPTLQNAPANEWTTDDEKDKHIGDLYYDKGTGHGYRFMYDDEEEVYLWTVLTDEDVTEALRIASEAQETADGKRTIYSVWGAWVKKNVNTLEVGDLFIPAANTTQGGVTYKANKVYKCTTDGSATFQAADYIDDAQAQAKIDAFVSNTYNPDKINLQSQIDGKAETFRQATDPSLDWYVEEGGEITLDVRANHVGDLWMDISANGGKKTYIYEDNGESADPRYEWKAQEVPEEVFDEIDGKSTIFGNAIATPPTNYKKDDMWLLPAAATINGTAYKKGDVLSASQDSTTYSAAHWSKKIRYTDDSAFNGYISAFLSGSGASGDSATAAAIQRAITSALGSALGSATLIDGGLMLTSLIGMRQLNDEGDPSDINDYTTWAGISGQYVARDSEDPQDPTAPWAKGHGIAAWYGGDMVDKEMLSDEEIANGWGTGEGQCRWAKSVDRFDGSGYRANGNITWNANGELAISDITSIQPSGSNTNVLNDMIQFSNAFHFNTVQGGSTILNIVPQYPFYSLYLYDTSQPNNRSHVASQKWVDDHYVTKTFFRQLFRAFKPNATAGQADVEVQPNTIDATISNIKAMVGLWTEQYISALGRGADGGGGGASVLYGLNDVSPNASNNQVLGIVIENGETTTGDGYVLTFNGSTKHWYAAPTAETYELPQATSGALGGIKIGYAASGKNYAIVLDANGKAYVNVPWTDTTYTLAGLMGSTAKGGATQPIYWNGSAFENTTYTLAKSVPADAKFTDTTYSFSNADATLAWSTRTKIATTGGTDIYVTLPANPNTNTWRNIFLDGTEKLTTSINTKGLNFVGDGKTTISFLAAGTEEGQSGNAEYATLKISSTWRGMQNNLTTSSSSTTDSLSAYQGYLLANGSARDNTKLPLTGGTLTGNLTINPSSGKKYIQIGTIRIGYDSDNNALKVYKVTTSNNVETEVAANFYALGAISALGQGVDGGGGGGQGDVTWDLLAHTATDNRFIDSSYISGALASYSLTSHTHTTTIAAGASTDTSQLTLAHGTKYKLTAGGTSFVFTMPSGYSLPTASSSTLGGVKVGSTLAISGGVLNLATSGVTAGTYKRVTVDAYGRVTAGDNTDSNTWRNIYLGGTSKVGTGTDTKALNFVAGSNVTISYEAAGTGDGKSGSADYFNIKIAATDTTYLNATQSAAGLMSASDKKKLDGVATNANNYSHPTGGANTTITNADGTVLCAITVNNLGHVTSVSSKTLAAADIPNLAASKITSGTFDSARIPSLAISKITNLQTSLDGKVNLSDTEQTIESTISDLSKGVVEFYRSSGNYSMIGFANKDGNGEKQTLGFIGFKNNAGEIAYRTASGTDYTIWHAGNDGADSGLDADLLDGTHKSGLFTALSSNSTTKLSITIGGTTKTLSTLYASYAAQLTTSRSLWGNSFNGTGDINGNIVMASSDGTYIQIGGARIVWDNQNKALKVIQSDNSTAANFYATGAISALGQGVDGGGGGGQGDVTWDLLSHTATNNRFIDSSYISGTLANYLPLSGGSNNKMTGTLYVGTSLGITDASGNGLLCYHPSTWVGVTSSQWGLGTTDSQGVIRSSASNLVHYKGDTAYDILDSSNSSVSLSGSTLTVKINGVSKSLTNSTYTLAGLMGSTAKGSTTQPIYWTGSAFANTSYTLGKSVPSDAKFTDTTYSANNGVSLSGTTFYNSGVRATTINGNYLRVNTNGTNADLTIPYATYSGYTPQLSQTSISSLSSFTHSTNFIYAAVGGSNSVPDKPSGVDAFGVFSYKTADGWYGQLLTSSNTGSGLYWRTASSTLSEGWRKVLDSSNYTEYTVTKGGSGASGTWGINITGNAGSVAWDNVTSKPSAAGGATTPVYWTGSGFTACTAYSSASVNYATSAGKATNDSDGNAINTTYLKLSGGTMTGAIVREGNALNTTEGFNQVYISNAFLVLGDGNPSRDKNTYLDGSNILFRTGSSTINKREIMRITSGGNVGIGTTTPSYKLDVVGLSRSDYHIFFNTARNGEAGYVGRGSSSSNDVYLVNYGANALRFLTNSSERMTITSDGSVGIGTNSPSYKLHVNGNGYYSGSLTINGNIVPNSDNAYNLGSTSNYWQNVYHYNSCVWNHVNIGYQKGQYSANRAELTVISRTDVPADIYFGCSNAYKWQISSRASGDSYNLNIYYSPSAGASFMSLTLDQSGNLISQGGVTALSDARHKQVIRDTNLSVEQIANMPSVIFKWTDGKHDNDLHVGTLAQSWQQVLPEVVLEGQDKEHTLSLSYGVAALVAAITTARKVVDHEARIKALERENRELREEISRLKIA